MINIINIIYRLLICIALCAVVVRIKFVQGFLQGGSTEEQAEPKNNGEERELKKGIDDEVCVNVCGGRVCMYIVTT